MAEPPRNSAVLVFDDFLAYLRQQGFIIGVDHYLRLQDLLNKIRGECGPGELSSLLCPIFATSESQQEKFYKAFGTFFTQLQSAPASTPGYSGEEHQSELAYGGEQPAMGARWTKAASFSAALGVVLSAVLFFLVIKPAPTNLNANINNHNGQNNQNGNANQNSSNNSGNRNERVKNTNERASGNKNDSPPSDLPTRPNVSNPSPQPMLGSSLRMLIRTGVTSAAILLLLIYEYFRYKRRKLVLQRQRAGKPPFVYGLQIESPAHRIFSSEQFYTAARRMRRRQTDKFHRLDVRATIDATTRSFGFSSFRYKPDSKVPEYLVLIDRESFRDHRAQLFDHLTRALSQEGLYVTSYFYDGDPRICCSVKGDYCQLSDLQNKHADDRLLIFGDGDTIIDPLTGELEPWTSILLSWPDRAVLTPEAPSDWGSRESSIASEFALAPADLSGLLAVVDYFENGTPIDPRLLTRDGQRSLPDQFDDSGAIEELRNHLGEEAFQWLCACAVYPELQWGLTLYLGSLPCMEGGLIKDESLLRLANLPWFRSGAIPDEIRLSLIRELDRSKGTSIRTAIIEMLEHTPPSRRETETFSADSYELNLAVDRQQNWLRNVIVKAPKKEVFRDYTLIRSLESAPSTLLALLLPRKLRAIFYPNAMPDFGLRTSARLVLTGILIAIIWFGLNWLMPPLPKAKIREFSASQKTITAGDTVNLFYGVSNASSVSISPQPGDVEVLEENVIEVAPDETTTYSLTATDSDKRSTSRQLTIEVVGERDLQIALLSVSPQTIASGQTASLCYEVREAIAVQINSGSDLVYSNQSTDALRLDKNCIQVTPLQTTAYTLTATGKDGKQATQTVTLNVVSPEAVRIDSFEADPPTINQGGKTKLCFQVTNAAGGTQIVSNFGEPPVVRNNCATVAPKQNTIYTLRAIGSSGTQERSLTVTVVPLDKPVIDEFGIFDDRGTLLLCYQVRNADLIEITVQGRRITSEKNDGQRTCMAGPAPLPGVTATIYTLKATSANGTEALKTFWTRVDPKPLEIARITVKPNPVIAGEAAQLCATVVGGARPFNIRIDPFRVFLSLSPKSPTDQACRVIRPTETTGITLTATDVSGQRAIGRTTVEVTQPPLKLPRIVSFTAQPSVVAPGETARLCYAVENADGVTFTWSTSTSRLMRVKGYKTALIIAQQGSPQQRSPMFVRGSKNCAPFAPTRTTTYTIEATNDSGKTDRKSVVVTVQEKAPETNRGEQPAANSSRQPGGTSNTGTIRGRVEDLSSNPIAGAKIVAITEASRKSFITRTDSNGSFQIALPPGNCTVSASTGEHFDATVSVKVTNTVIQNLLMRLRLRSQK